MDDGHQKDDLADAFFTALFGTEQQQERVRRKVRARDYAQAERSRVADLVRQLGEYEAEERHRREVIARADPVELAYLKIGPTPEMIAKGRFETVEARLLHQHDVRTTTSRRVLVPRVYDLHLSGVISHEQLICCRWYHDCWEATGLIGNIPATQYGKEVFSAPQSRSMFTDFQLDAQEAFRTARSAITARWRPFFDAVVLEDVGLRRALLRSRGDNSKAKSIFRDCTEELQTAYDQLKKR